MLLGYRGEKKESHLWEKKSLVLSVFPPLHTVRGSPSTAEPDQAFTKIGSKRWVSLSEKPLRNSAHISPSGVSGLLVSNHGRICNPADRPCSPNPPMPCQLQKQDIWVYVTPICLFSGMATNFLAGYDSQPLLWRGECMKLMFLGPCSNTISVPQLLALGREGGQ